MKIELQEPFKSIWKSGYLVINNQNRKNVILSNDSIDRTTTSYARYLMGVKLGYLVPDEYEVDHKDNDKTNDDIDNLQLLTSEQNKLKEYNRYLAEEQISYGYQCAYCDNSFILSNREVTTRLFYKTERAFCSRSCAASFNFSEGKLSISSSISEEDKNKIKLLRSEGKTSYQISSITGFARNTVMKYW